MKTLFCSGKDAKCALVVKRGARRRLRHLQFVNPHGALDWCMARGVSFVWVPAGVEPG